MELGYLLVVNNNTATVIIVDDEANGRLQMAEILKSSGYSTIMAFDGGTALDFVKREQFEVVFMDLRSSYIKSSRVTQGFRRLFTNQMMPIIAITDLNTDQWKFPQDEQKLWQGVLERPIDPELIYQIMALMMDRHMTAI